MYLTIFHYQNYDAIFLRQYFDENKFKFDNMFDDVNNFIRQICKLSESKFIKKYPLYLLVDNGSCFAIYDDEKKDTVVSIELEKFIPDNYDMIYFSADNVSDYYILNEKIGRHYFQYLYSTVKNLSEMKLSAYTLSVKTFDQVIKNQDTYVSNFFQ